MIKIYPFSDFLPGYDDDNGNSIIELKPRSREGALFQDDMAFDRMYPEHYRLISSRQWTALAIAREAATFLAEPGSRVLDIGSGVGKFCLAAAYYHQETFFYGVEQRQELANFAVKAQNYTGLNNVTFVNANLTQLGINEFDHFYFYNSFYENLDPANRIDDTIETSPGLYTYYTQYLFTALEQKLPGTRLVTFHSFEEEIPPGYCLVGSYYHSLLKMWIKR